MKNGGKDFGEYTLHHTDSNLKRADVKDICDHQNLHFEDEHTSLNLIIYTRFSFWF